MAAAITDELWAELAPPVERAKRSRAGAPPAIPDRQFLEALLYPADSGCKWRQLPGRFDAWDAVHDRFRRRVAAGVFERLLDGLPPGGAAADGVRRVFIDSTVIRAHARAAGAAKKGAGKRPGPSAAAGAGPRPSSTSPAPTTARRSRSS